MKLRDSRFATVRAGMWALAAAVISSLALIGSAHAEERQYLVILATSAKEFPPAGIQGGQLPNPEAVRKQYFDRVDPNIGSFAEYWEEISYGDVTIRGQVTDWIVLPWAIQPQQAGFQDLNQAEEPFASYEYGAGERFDNSRAMVMVDINGDPFGNDDGPFEVTGNPDYALGGNDESADEVDVWMPGERFVDFDGDGKWDGLDEATNQMDWNGDNRPDLRGPWVDLNVDGVPDNEGRCVYLPDDDNDGIPNCCGQGPGSERGCSPFPAAGACPATSWTGPTGEVLDCNGNLIPDSCDLSPLGTPNQDCRATGWLNLMGDPNCNLFCGASEGHDQLPMTSAGEQGCILEPSDGDGIPDECQFDSYTVSLECVDSEITDDQDGCFGTPVCEDIQTRDAGATQRCEYDDSNANGRLDIVEPFENFLRRWDRGAEEWVEVDADYITANYPGSAIRLINRGQVRPVYADADVTSEGCHCSTECNTDSDCPGAERCDRFANRCECISFVPGLSQPACIAGFHAEYDPPDEWTEQDEEFGSNKMQANGFVRNSVGSIVFTPEPSWYAQAWLDRYGVEAPPWSAPVPRFEAVDQESRRTFRASHGGTHGDGTGWVGCSNEVDGSIEFEGGLEEPTRFETDCNRQILPEETVGIGERLRIYDGPVEHDDLPSSKYHVAGDQRLGEVTSPFNENIWGHDRGTHISGGANQEPDRVIPPAGPYAKHVHGNLGRDAGNVLQMEVLSWRREAPFNTGEAWEQWYGEHPYAESLGFRDYNLDGLIDQGEVRVAGTENYLQQPNGRRHGTGTEYPFNRLRMLEDCIGILDDLIDFDDFVDTATLNHVLCGAETPAIQIPRQYWGGEFEEQFVAPAGLLSGIVLLPNGSHTSGDFVGAGSYYPIHNEDGLGDSRFRLMNFPRTPRVELETPVPNFAARISWNIFFNDLVKAIGVESSSGTIPTGGFQTAYSAHEYLHTWERFPDLYDYDVWEPNTIENCPVGRWDVMAGGGLVHPAPILKEKPCTGWITSVDLATVLTPGVDTILTLPPAEFQRDKSYFFLENESRPGERYYLWSVGKGFDQLMPGLGMLIMHTDVTPACETDGDCPDGIDCVNGFCDGAVSNPDAPPPQQRNTTRPTYLIVQADGAGELQTCESRGDAGDVWPGSTGATRFNFETNPPATWYTQNSWTGLDIREILTDGEGSARITINWVPTSIPSLRFLDPPGGESVGTSYQVRFLATDVFGGSTIDIYYTEDRKTCGSGTTVCTEHADCSAGTLCTHDVTITPGGGNRVGTMQKRTPGTNELSMNWNISTVPDGRYVLFAKLQPGAGADGSESPNTTPHPGRNNKGSGSLAVVDVDVAGNNARSESWTAVCIDADAGLWRVNSSLSQPVLNEINPESDPYSRATTNVLYESAGGEVKFRISSGSDPFELGDTFTFTTTGITAPSGGITIREQRITLDPVAKIFAAPLAGPPPLTVTFDARDSFDPNGEPIVYLWDFGDASATASGPVVEHTFTDAGTFTTVLQVANPQNARFNETAVDIEVTNNSPHAVISATPTSGSAPLTVQFSAGQSSDTETESSGLIYHWDFGDGGTANDAHFSGSTFLSISHFYRDQNGVACDHDNPCMFTATLTVIDEGGKQDTDTISILVGNVDPVPVISHTSLRLTVNNLEVVFNALNSFDPDPEDTNLTVTWTWGDASVPPEETFPLTGAAGATDGSVPHTYVLPAGQTTGSFHTTAVVRDGRGGEGEWAGVTITVNEAAVGSSSPRAIFAIDPLSPKLDEEFTVDGSLSFDRPVGSPLASYTWNFGDNSAPVSGVTATHTYTQAGSYTIALTVADGETPPNTDTTRQTVIIAGEGGGGEPLPDNLPPTAAFTVNPPSGFAGTTSFVFNASGSTDPDGDDSKLTFRWSFGDGSNATGATPPPHVYAVANPSGYPVRLTVRDEGNASTTAVTEVIVEGSAGNVAPVAHIATGPRTGTAPLTLTFDGRNSYDPNGDSLEYRWEFFDADGELIDTLTGEIVTRLFSTVGMFTVDLEVLDGRGASDRAGSETILVTERGQAPPIDDEPGQDVPDDNGDPNSADQRPGRFCAFGALPGMFGSLLGLMALTAVRRRRRI